MNNIQQPGASLVPGAWSITKVEETPTPARNRNLINRWHTIASPPPLQKNATIAQRERYRHMRPVHATSSGMIIVFPYGLYIPDIYVRYIVLFVIATCLLSLLFNRMGHTPLAIQPGVAIVASLTLIIASATASWLHSISKATRQGHQTAFVKNLGHAVVQQGKTEAQEKKEEASYAPELPLPPYYTKTILSPLTLTVARLHRLLLEHAMPSSPHIQQKYF